MCRKRNLSKIRSTKTDMLSMKTAFFVKKKAVFYCFLSDEIHFLTIMTNGYGIAFY